MIQITNRCPANHPCPLVRICPTGAIKQETPYSLPTIDMDLCVECEACTTRCPYGAVKTLVEA